MARYKHHIYKVYIADGFGIDCDELIHKCLQLPKVDYHEFCKIWKEMDFSMVFHGRNTGAEIAELSEEIAFLSKQYLVKNTPTYEESVAGLFLVYGVLSLQPYPNFAWLRLTPDDIPAIKRIETVARQDKRLDVLYILGEVLIKYTQYHAIERERGMESVLRKYLDGYTTIDKLGVRPKGVFYRQNEELDILRDLGTITRQYTKAKKLIGEGPDQNLHYIDENLAVELDVTLKKIINGIIDDDKGDNSSDNHYNAVQEIKNKAMSNTVDNMKHLTTIEDKPSTQTKRGRKSKRRLRKRRGKNKSGSPSKETVSTPVKKIRKRRADEGLGRKKKICLEDLSNKETDAGDLDLGEFQFDARVIAEGAEDGTTQTKETDIQIDPTSVVVGNDLENSMHIEYIDQVHKEVEPADTTVKFRRTEKRDLKRLHLKSKFRRLGMLPVANFKDSNNSGVDNIKK